MRLCIKHSWHVMNHRMLLLLLLQIVQAYFAVELALLRRLKNNYPCFHRSSIILFSLDRSRISSLLACISNARKVHCTTTLICQPANNLLCLSFCFCCLSSNSIIAEIGALVLTSPDRCTQNSKHKRRIYYRLFEGG